jgi:hypothetical protein
MIVIEEDDKIFIQDQTGKSWDITHAVNRYGFAASYFQSGLGPFALTPITEPLYFLIMRPRVCGIIFPVPMD